MTCCGDPAWVTERDLEHAGGFEFVLGECQRCGAPWMQVFCGASEITGYEPVTQADVAAIRSIRDGRELKEFMRRWGDGNL